MQMCAHQADNKHVCQPAKKTHNKRNDEQQFTYVNASAETIPIEFDSGCFFRVPQMCF